MRRRLIRTSLIQIAVALGAGLIIGFFLPVASQGEAQEASTFDWLQLVWIVGGSAVTSAFVAQGQHYSQELKLQKLELELEHQKDLLAVKRAQTEAEIGRLTVMIESLTEAGQNSDRFLSARIVDIEAFLQINHGYQKRRTPAPVNSGLRDDAPTGGWIG